MKINKQNVCEILMFCLCYKDSEIINECFSYLKNNIDDEILIKLIHITNVFPNGLKEIEQQKMYEFERRGYKFLYNNEYLMRLEINNLKMLLSFDNIIIRNELWLLNRLMEWFNFKKNNSSSNNDDDDELVNEFKCLIEENIDGEKINEIKLMCENEALINKLNIKFNKNKETKHIDLYKIKDENIQNLIINRYLNDDEMEISQEEKEILNNIEEEELNRVILLLLKMDNIKIIKIVLMIIIYKHIRTDFYISNIDKRNFVSKLCAEYNESKNSIIVEYLSLFVDDKKYIKTIEDLCGKEVLFNLLNKDNFLNSESKEILINYGIDMKLSSEEEEEMSRIIKNKEIIEELKTKEITSFSYPQLEFFIVLNEEMSIIPSFNGSRCEFSISPPLPLGLAINKENGIINGKVENEIETKEYEVCCKNRINEKKFKISLDFLLAKFTELNKSFGISILDNGRVITNTNGNWSHCYLNMKMEKGIYQIKYQFNHNNWYFDSLVLGLSTNNIYSGINIHSESTTCEYFAWGSKSQVMTSWCHIGTIVNKNPNFNHHGNGSIYEVIVDMNKREYWISHNNSSPVLLVKDLPSPLYPYAGLVYKNTSIKLLSISHQN